MARPRKQLSAPSLSPGQASYVLDRLVNDRHVSPADINRYVSEMRNEISELEQRLQRLRAAHGIGETVRAAAAVVAPFRRGRKPGRPGRPPGRTGRPPGRPPGRPKKIAAAAAAGAATAGAAAAVAAARGSKKGRRRAKSPITPEQLASRQLQGRYLALVRQFPATRRAQFARTAKEKGRESAIREMQDSLKK